VSPRHNPARNVRNRKRDRRAQIDVALPMENRSCSSSIEQSDLLINILCREVLIDISKIPGDNVPRFCEFVEVQKYFEFPFIDVLGGCARTINFTELAKYRRPIFGKGSHQDIVSVDPHDTLFVFNNIICLEFAYLDL
jgi:hypothetical protein